MNYENKKEEINNRFQIEGVKCELNEGELPYIVIDNNICKARVCLLGASVVEYTQKGQEPIIWLSEESWFETGKPIRGGVPICWPWFGPHPTDTTIPNHGFVRTQIWDIIEISEEADSIKIVLGFMSNDENKAVYNNDFALKYTVIFGKNMEIELTTRNMGENEMEFTEALHTYLNVSDSRNVEITGLKGVSYIDEARNDELKTQETNPIIIENETDRVFQNTTSTVEVKDSGFKRTLQIAKENSLSTVVWNPWIAKSTAMPDFGADEWQTMLCVETANAAEHKVKLNKEEEHSIKAIISVK